MPSNPLFGPYGSAAMEYADRLASNGANAAWFHGFDAAAFDACQKHGLAACVEFKTFRADFNAHPELIPIGADGKPVRYGELVQGVCLSNTAFLEETEAHLREGLRDFQPAGIWLDYLTYTGWFEMPDPDLQESCFCSACIAVFNEATGIDARSPGEILATAAGEWERHKCQRIAGFTAHYAALIREALPECVIGAYMCPWTPGEFDRALTRIFAQDYAVLAPSIDVFTPLIYATKSGRGPAWGREFLTAAVDFIPADRPVQLILDALDFPDSLLETARSAQPSWGLQMFGGAQVFADPQSARVFAEAVAQIRRRIEGGSLWSDTDAWFDGANRAG